MSFPENSDRILQFTRTGQVIIRALVLGLLMFLAFTCFLNPRGRGNPRQAGGTLSVTKIALGFTVMALLASTFVPKMVSAKGRRPLARNARDTGLQAATVEALLSSLLAQTIVAAAILEGAAFFALVAYFLEGSLVALAVAVLLILGVAYWFPTRTRVEQWLQDQLQALEQERSLE